MSLVKQIRGWLTLVRWPNLIMLAISQLAFRYALLIPLLEADGQKSALNDMQFALLVVVTVIVAAAGYLINDFFDLPIDRVNRPNRPLVTGLIQPKSAQLGFYILAFIAAVWGFWLSASLQFWMAGWFFVLHLMGLYLYSRRWKNRALTGNLMVAVFTAMSLLVVWGYEQLAFSADNALLMSTEGAWKQVNRMAGLFALFAFTSTLIRELIKDMEDLKGDRQFHLSTLPIIWKIPHVKLLTGSLIVLLMALVASVLINDLLMQTPYIRGYYFLFVIVPLGVLAGRLKNAKWTKDFANCSRLTKYIMLSGLLGMLLIGWF